MIGKRTVKMMNQSIETEKALLFNRAVDNSDTFHLNFSTPYGELELIGNSIFITGLKFLPQKFTENKLTINWSKYPPLAKTACHQLQEYFLGKRRDFDLPLKLEGTAFQMAVWEKLAQIPFGQTKTYGQLAKELGKPGASRAVGGANNRNRLPIFVPCHRVIGSRGQLVGFAGGMPWKEALLRHEGILTG